MPEDRASRAEVLRRVPLFSGLSEKEVESLAARAVPRRYPAGETIFSEGETCAGLFVVEEGALRIVKCSSGGREQVLAIEGPGNSVAELPVFDGGSYPASAMAVVDTRTLFISKQDFQALCRQNPEVALKVLRVVGSRLRHLVEIVEELSFTTVRHRLAAYLLRMAKRYGKPTPRGTEFRIPISNQEIAARIGTVRELVSRNLGRLEAKGVLKVEGKKVTVPDLRVLEAEVKEKD